jgi:hypothetical protein
MADGQMNPALKDLMSRHPPTDTERLWDQLTEAAWKLPKSRGEAELPGERVAKLRERLRGELVAFHKRLLIAPYTRGDVTCSPGCTLMQVNFPVTLFPKRDQGFKQVDCMVEFSTSDGSTDAFRVLRLFPEERSIVQAHAELGASLQVDANARVGLKLPPTPALALSDEVAARVYGNLEVGQFNYEARRMCVETEIIEGTGARWRLDDTTSAEKVGVESHQLAVVLEVKQGAPPIHAAAYMQVKSDPHWLTATVGSFWQNLQTALRNFFKGGVPREAYGEWQDILSASATRSPDTHAPSPPA